MWGNIKQLSTYLTGISERKEKENTAEEIYEETTNIPEWMMNTKPQI